MAGKAIAATLAPNELLGELLLGSMKYYERLCKRRAQMMFDKVRLRASQRNHEFDLTTDWIYSQLRRGECAVTGIKFDFLGRNGVSRPKKHAPSIDRIDSDRGYTIDNCHVVIYQYNTAKGCWNHEDVMALAKALCEKEAEQCQS